MRILLSVLLLAVAAFCSAFDSGVCAGDVCVGTYPEFAPFTFKNETGGISGFEIDLINAIGREEGFVPATAACDFNALLNKVAKGKFDAAIATITVTGPRSEITSFSRPYYTTGQVVVRKAGEPRILGALELKGLKVAVQAGTTGAMLVEQAVDPESRAMIVYRDTYAGLIETVKSGAADAAVMDNGIAEYLLRGEAGLKIVSPLLTKEEYGIAVAKNNPELLDRINRGLDKLEASGELAKLRKKWFGPE